MRHKKRVLALLLCVSMLMSLCGCLPIPLVTRDTQKVQTEQDALPQAPEPEESMETLAGGSYFTPMAREALSFDEMTLGEMTLDDFRPYAEALTAAAAKESREAFHRACVEAERMLVRIDTAGSLFE